MANPFPRFDVAPACPTDHYYIGSSVAPFASGLHKKIAREWKLLQSHLPDSIHARVYEDRITLLRAAIAGASGTPYHDGLFFFDVEFPANYPTSPPKVQYRSFGLRINPNLNSDGSVCLSLINTWYGKKGESWDPSQSTILQVLLSIQALVLNERPFFNEPLFGKRKIWNPLADDYNESAFCLSCRTMLYVISKPPADFEPLVIEHFLERGRRILLAARAYVSGRARVGYYSPTEVDDRAVVSSRGQHNLKKKYRKDLVGLYPHMVTSFRSHGVAVDDLLELRTEEPASKGKVGERIKKAWSKFKQVFGFNSSA